MRGVIRWMLGVVVSGNGFVPGGGAGSALVVAGTNAEPHGNRIWLRRISVERADGTAAKRGN